MIQWKKRLTNKTFWLALIPAVLLLVQQTAALCALIQSIAALSPTYLVPSGSIMVGVCVMPSSLAISRCSEQLTILYGTFAMRNLCSAPLHFGQ